MIDISGLVGLLGLLAIGVALLLLGLLSRRMTHVTHSRPHHIGLFVASILVWIGAGGRFMLILQEARFGDMDQNLLWVLLVNGIPALGLTLGLVIAWRYWSWLLADRD